MILDDPRLRPAFYLIAISIIVYLALTVGIELTRNRRLNHGLSINIHRDEEDKEEIVATPVNEKAPANHDATPQTFNYDGVAVFSQDLSSDEEKDEEAEIYYQRWQHGQRNETAPSKHHAGGQSVTAAAPSAPPYKYQYINN